MRAPPKPHGSTEFLYNTHMETKVSYTLVGLFVIVLGLALTGAVLWLTVGAQDKIFDTYVVYVQESVAGLNPKATVRYRGVDVGQVSRIRLDPKRPDRVELVLDIERGTPIREDTVATLVVQGLTGLATVELTGGDPESPDLTAAEGMLYPEIPSSPSLIKRLDDAFTDAMNKLDRLSSDLAALLRPENQRAVSEILANLSALSELIAGRSGNIQDILESLKTVGGVLVDHRDDIGQALGAAQETLENSAKASAELNRLMAQIGAGANAVQRMADTISATSVSLNKTVLDSRRDLQQLTARTTPELNALLYELTRLTDTIQKFVQELDRNPQILLFGKPGARPGPGERQRNR